MTALAKKASKDKSATYPPYEKIYKSDPLAEVDAVTRERVGQMEHYIMKNCLWQYNSRGWDRRKQNAGIIGKTAQLLCGEEVDNPNPLEKCYWVDAVMLARAYREICSWLNGMDTAAIKSLMTTLHQRMDWVMIDGSLNEELTVQHY
ncbi:MAG TPA: Fe-only nitrogenase subunit delta [Candidatus Sulfotelmatobacter sp.]|jgi:nitrogenase delta subunit|nr:Fe-only nitrogenase subunit delta [Candidatus Sulfotelmatobacter sp.]